MTVFVKLPEGVDLFHQSDSSDQPQVINLRPKIRQEDQNKLKPKYGGSKNKKILSLLSWQPGPDPDSSWLSNIERKKTYEFSLFNKDVFVTNEHHSFNDLPTHKKKKTVCLCQQYRVHPMAKGGCTAWQKQGLGFILALTSHGWGTGEMGVE